MERLNNNKTALRGYSKLAVICIGRCLLLRGDSSWRFHCTRFLDRLPMLH